MRVHDLRSPESRQVGRVEPPGRQLQTGIKRDGPFKYVGVPAVRRGMWVGTDGGTLCSREDPVLIRVPRGLGAARLAFQQAPDADATEAGFVKVAHLRESALQRRSTITVTPAFRTICQADALPGTVVFSYPERFPGLRRSSISSPNHGHP